MSNTAAATMLIPLAAGIDPAPSTAILIAIAASLGIPFAISTPPNAMVYGEGGITFSDLAILGLILNDFRLRSCELNRAIRSQVCGYTVNPSTLALARRVEKLRWFVDLRALLSGKFSDKSFWYLHYFV